jgi:hypothetical protein
MKTCYVASKSRHWHMWEGLRNHAGANIISRPGSRLGRHDDQLEISAVEWAAHADLCLSQAASADVPIVHVREDDPQQFGALLECGAALGAGKTVFLVARTRSAAQGYAPCISTREAHRAASA